MPKKYTRRVKRRVKPVLLRPAADEAGRPAKPAAGDRWRKRRRITDGLIGLSSAIVLSVYAVGYLRTQEPDEPVANQNVAQVQSSAPSPGSLSSPAKPNPQSGTYRDGTYVATGKSRHGPIEATVVVRGGKIASASVSGCGTRYPCSDVNPLIREVLTRQSAPVDYVSGATDSSQAYTDAVKSALAQAS